MSSDANFISHGQPVWPGDGTPCKTYWSDEMSEPKDYSPNQNREKQDNDWASLTSPGLSAVSFQLASPQGHATFQYRKKECCLDPATDSLDLSISFGPSPEKRENEVWNRDTAAFLTTRTMRS